MVMMVMVMVMEAEMVEEIQKLQRNNDGDGGKQKLYRNNNGDEASNAQMLFLKQF